MPTYIYGISPNVGVSGTPGHIPIYGAYLAPQGTTPQVTMDGATLWIVYQSDNQITVYYDSVSLGTHWLTVTTIYGQSNAVQFTPLTGDHTPSITSISPDHCDAGTTMGFSIAGTGFGTNPGLTIDGEWIEDYGVHSAWDTGMNAWVTVSPNAPDETVTVSVTSNGYWGNSFMEQYSTPPPPPQITVCPLPSPAWGPGSQWAVIGGSGFWGNTPQVWWSGNGGVNFLESSTATVTSNSQIDLSVSLAPVNSDGSITLGIGTAACVIPVLFLAPPPSCVVPVNFRQYSSEPVCGERTGVLSFLYIWDSASGNRQDLQGCQIREFVWYDNGGQPQSPPFPSSTFTDPTIVVGSAVNEGVRDNHSPPTGSFVHPYSEATFNAHQTYQYKCACQATTERTDFPNFSQILVQRKVTNSDGPWKYSIAKSGKSCSLALPSKRGGIIT